MTHMAQTVPDMFKLKAFQFKTFTGEQIKDVGVFKAFDSFFLSFN